jgi:hypothetical protein
MYMRGVGIFDLQGNTAMNFRKISFAAATIVALAPAVSNASPEKSAVEACARAFASSFATTDAAAPAYTVDYRGIQYVESVTDMYTRGYTFHLFAKSRKTGLPIAQASCTTDKRGVVVALSPLPQDSAPPPALTARD